MKTALEFIKIESNIPSSLPVSSASKVPKQQKPEIKTDSSIPVEARLSTELATHDRQKKEPKGLVEQKRKVYYNRFVESLDMMISGNYAHIGKSGGKITVKKEGKVVKEVFANKLSSLIINAHGTTISADA